MGLKPKPRVVVVMAGQDPVLESIQDQLDQLDVNWALAVSLKEFRRLTRRSEPPKLVLTGVSLPDGNWCDVLASTVRAQSAAPVVVCSQTVDERFWFEAIWRGVLDVLVAPISAEYLRRYLERDSPNNPTAKTGDSRKGKTPLSKAAGYLPLAAAWATAG